MKYLTSIILFMFCLSSFAADSSDMNQSNNPLTPMLGINFQDYYVPSIFGTNKTSNTSLLRGIFPHKTGGNPQIMRLTIPHQSVPVAGENNVTGYGDVNLFDVFLMKLKNGIDFGVGPYFVFPTATETETGSGLWQAGFSTVALKPSEAGIFGALLTYQHSFAGPSERPTQNLATVQPFFIHNLPQSFYLRSSAVMNYNMQNGNYVIPAGFGAGKVWKLQSGSIVNLSVEPQWTLFHEGGGQSNFQVFGAINLQFPL